MKLSKRSSALVAAGITAAMMLSACGGSDEEPSGDGGTEASSGGEFSIYIGEPENPLVPGNTNESEGSQVVEALWTGLVEYGDDSSVQYTGVAESIESEDATTWTVTLKDGWTFHDGTPVTAESFVNAWNYTALSTNAQGGSYFFSNIEGYDAPAGRDRRRRQRGRRAGRHGDERPRGRRRHVLHRHADRALRPVPGDRGLQRLLPAARVLLRGPGRRRQAPRG